MRQADRRQSRRDRDDEARRLLETLLAGVPVALKTDDRRHQGRGQVGSPMPNLSV